MGNRETLEDMFEQVEIIRDFFKEKLQKELDFDCDIEVQQDGACYISMKSKIAL